MSAEARAARLGMWVFLASEVLFFAVLFTLYAAARARHAAVFHAEIHAHADKVLGSLNTALLLVSSTLVAAGLEAERRGRRPLRFLLFVASAAIGVVFLAIKGHEYSGHAAAGLVPGHDLFWTLYFTMTGLHALHVAAGVVALVLAALTGKVARVENVALYWHFVDAVWIFLWPLFYLA